MNALMQSIEILVLQFWDWSLDISIFQSFANMHQGSEESGINRI